MSAVTTVLSGEKPPKGKERAARSALACDGREARPGPAPEIHTPPSNTGVNNGEPSKGVSLNGGVGYKALPSSRKLSKLLPIQSTSEKGRIVRGQSGQFEEKTPLTDARMFAEVLELQRALEKVESLMRSVAASAPLQHRKAPLGVADYLRLFRGVISQHTDISDEPLPGKGRRRS